jgi:Gas vesicle synthesis protein GvpO
MAEVREQRQRERADARAGRRTDADDRNHESQDDGTPVDLKRAFTAAFTAAVAGALAGAAKAAVDKHRRGANDQQDAEDDGDEAEQNEQGRSRAPTDEGETEGAEDEVETEAAEDPDASAGFEDQVEQDGDPDVEAAQDEESGEEGASSADAASTIARAKEHVEAVLGSPAESVSGIGRENGNWRVNVEVVQMRRVPESTDILASYTVVLDAEGDLISVQELRRYRRSQAEGSR